MAVLMLLLVLTIGGSLFCSSVDAQEAYDKLDEPFKKGVNLSLEKLSNHSSIQNHFLFFRSVAKSDVEAGFDVVFIYHHFYLKPTKCPKGTTDPSGCSFRNDVPMIDCAICYKTFQGDIEAEPKPYLNCLHKPSVTPEVRTNRIEHCNRLAYSHGATNLLASTGTDKMASLLLLLLFACIGGSVWRSAEAQSPLPDDYKMSVDLALSRLESTPRIFRFWKTLEKSNSECCFGGKYYYHHFQLKPTSCVRSLWTTILADSCPFVDNAPLVDCSVCYKAEGDIVLQDFVHCVQRPRLTRDMVNQRRRTCDAMNYRTGSLSVATRSFQPQ
nr:uncharacterized protein LOC133600914 [Nerophis lumbriciformis]